MKLRPADRTDVRFGAQRVIEYDAQCPYSEPQLALRDLIGDENFACRSQEGAAHREIDIRGHKTSKRKRVKTDVAGGYMHGYMHIKLTLT